MGPEYKWPFPYGYEKSWLRKCKSIIALTAVGSLSKFWLQWLNTVKVYNKNVLYEAVKNRPPGQSLLTVGNHLSCLDDPIIWGILKWRMLLNPAHQRWVQAAADVCFTKPFHASFLSLGRVVPVIRGEGVYQKSVDFMLDKLNSGEWVHIFAEGKVNMTHELLRFKWGVGRLVSECRNNPLIVPMWHLGMDDLLPNTPPYIPRIRKKVTVLFGEPIDLSELVRSLHRSDFSPVECRKQITDHIQQKMHELKEKAEKLHQIAN